MTGQLRNGLRSLRGGGGIRAGFRFDLRIHPCLSEDRVLLSCSMITVNLPVMRFLNAAFVIMVSLAYALVIIDSCI